MSDIVSTLLGFARYVQASYRVLGEELDRLHIRTEVYHGSLGQDTDMEREHGTVQGVI